MTNLFDAAVTWDDDDPPGYHTGYLKLAPLVGGDLLGASIYELPPGQSVCPYHWEAGEEEWLLVLAGRPTVRVPDGEHELDPGDLVCFPAGEAGAHKVTNRTEETVRVLMLSDVVAPSWSVYPDSNKVGVWPLRKLFRIDDAVDYFEGEL